MSPPHTVVFGADPSSCDVVFQEPSVSGQHCQIWRAEDGLLYIADMHSSNGTALNQRWLEANCSYQVQAGDNVALGQSYAFQLTTQHLSSLMPSAIAPLPHSPCVPRPSGEPEARTAATSVVYGRNSSAVDVLVDGDGVSSVHFEIRRTDSGYLLHDLGSSNGTFVHNQRVQAGHPVPVSLGDTIRMGQHATVVLQAVQLKTLGSLPVSAVVRGTTRLEEAKPADTPSAPPAVALHAQQSSPVFIREEAPAPVVIIRETEAPSSSGTASLLILFLLGAMWFTNPTRQDFENHIVENAKKRGELTNQVTEAVGRAQVRDFANRAGRQSLAIGCIITLRDRKGRRHRWVGIFKSFFKVPA